VNLVPGLRAPFSPVHPPTNTAGIKAYRLTSLLVHDRTPSGKTRRLSFSDGKQRHRCRQPISATFTKSAERMRVRIRLVTLPTGHCHRATVRRSQLPLACRGRPPPGNWSRPANRHGAPWSGWQELIPLDGEIHATPTPWLGCALAAASKVTWHARRKDACSAMSANNGMSVWRGELHVHPTYQVPRVHRGSRRRSGLVLDPAGHKVR
jgi:hypothetical protein